MKKTGILSTIDPDALWVLCQEFDKKEELTQKERSWIADFRRVLNRKPKDIEVVVDDGSISIYPTGTLERHIGSAYDYGGIGTDPDENNELAAFENKGKLLPYSEGQ